MNRVVTGFSLLLLQVFAAHSINPKSAEIPASLPNLNLTELAGKVVGGVVIQPNEFKHLVLIYYNNQPKCAGSLIDAGDNWPAWVLTSANCANGPNIGSYRLVAGEHDFYQTGGTEQVRGVYRVVFHPRWNSPGAVDNEADIAIMMADNRFDLNAYVQPVPLASFDFEETATATVVGWGSTFEDGAMSNLPRKVTVPFVNDTECGENYDIVDSMVCYGESGKDSCVGDSGGPLMCGDVLCGIVSFGIGCGRDRFPGVYTQLSYFVTWIQARIKPWPEDTIPALTMLDCGGLAKTTSARISVNLMGQQRCSYMIQAPYGRARIVLRSRPNVGTSVYVAEHDRRYDMPKSESTRIVMQNQNYTFFAPLFYVILDAKEVGSQLLTIDIFSSSYEEEMSEMTSLDFFNVPSGQGLMRYPETGAEYDPSQLTAFLVSPSNIRANMTLTFRTMDIEWAVQCQFDSLRIFEWRGDRFYYLGRFCGTELPSPMHSDNADFLLMFNSGRSVAKSGFSVTW